MSDLAKHEILVVDDDDAVRDSLAHGAEIGRLCRQYGNPRL